jgi:hypothetical protein
MANKWYPLGLSHFAKGDIAYLSDTIKAMLVTSGYTYSAAHEFVSDIGGGNIVARGPALGTKTVGSGGILNAASEVLTAVSGSAVAAVILYKDTGVDATSELLIIWDTATGLPLTPNGGDVTINWDVGTNKIGAL